MNLVQTEESCLPQAPFGWRSSVLAECSLGEHVAFSDEKLDFEMGGTSDSRQKGRIILVNRERFSLVVVPNSVPSWVDFTSNSLSEMTLKREPLTLHPVEVLPGVSCWLVRSRGTNSPRYLLVWRSG